MNMFIHSHAGFMIEADKAKAILRRAKVVASDETGVQIEGTNSYHWVFHCKDAVVHQPIIRAPPGRGRIINGHTPNVSISVVIPRSKDMAPRIKPVWRIWRGHGLCAGAWIGRSAPAVQAVVRQGVRSGQRYRQFQSLDDRQQKTRP